MNHLKTKSSYFLFIGVMLFLIFGSIGNLNKPLVREESEAPISIQAVQEKQTDEFSLRTLEVYTECLHDTDCLFPK
jgi:hypothetical protein